jgi:ATP-dependent RNA helicase MSS116, mitochondrial
VIARARTGTGKTLAYLLPSLERIVGRKEENNSSISNNATKNAQRNKQIEILIVAPTRELAQQIGQEAQLLTSGFVASASSSSSSHQAEELTRTISSATFVGGRPRALDVRAMEKSGIPNILVVTPGRLLDHLNSTHVNDVPFRDLVKHVQVLVLDEMDSLLDLGFRDAIQEILCYLPQQRQTLLFSATIPPQVRDVIEICVAPNRVLVDCIQEEDPMTHTNERINQTHVILPLDKSVWGTVQIILELMKEPNHKILVFFPTTAQVCFFAKLFNLGMGRPVLEIHSRLAQNRRTQTSDRFRHSRRRRGVVMFTSDVSARGVDYPDVTHVIQVGMAPKRESYLHRLGRTGRADKNGQGILLLTEPEMRALDTDLNGLEITGNAHFQQMIDNGHMSPELEEDRMRIVSQMRAGELRDLETDAKAVYSGLLGFYFSKLRTLGVRQPQNVVVNIMNEFAAQAGLSERPTLPMKLAAQYRLANHPAVNVREEWRAGRNFDVGLGRGRLSKNRFAIPSENSNGTGRGGGGDLWGGDDDAEKEEVRNSGGSKGTR